MKKLLKVLLLVILTVSICVPFVACGDNNETQTERKRIIGIDSEKTYLKAKFYLADNYDLNYKELDFDFYSRDKIEASEFRGVEFGLTEEFKSKMSASEYKMFGNGQLDDNGYYWYNVNVVINMIYVTHEVRVNSITLKISDQDDKFKTDIYFFMHNHRPVFIKPETFHTNYNTADPQSGPYCVNLRTRYDMSFKSLKFQTEGFEILSYRVEAFDYETETREVIEGLPETLEAKKTYYIYRCHSSARLSLL